jgi:deoxyadenosine/deoxycytidine kinase
MRSGALARAYTRLMPEAHIAISGLVGAGKTTLVNGLAAELGSLALPERDDENPYLARFYEEPARWAFKSFVFFAQQTLDDYRRARSSPSGAVQERVLEEHLTVFGAEFHRRGYLDDDDLGVLSTLTAGLSDLVRPPDLLIHLEIEPAEALLRLRQRALAIEESVEVGYLESLGSRYDDLLASWPGELLRIDAKASDFRDRRQVAELAAVVDERLAATGVA